MVDNKTPTELETIKSAIREHWSQTPSDKARRYVGQFFNPIRRGAKIIAQVVGNHGTYTVSIQVEVGQVSSACSCYIGKGGFCHHCHALAITFLNNPIIFQEIKTRLLTDVRCLSDVEEYLQGRTLDSFLSELKKAGITQKEFAESIGMNPRHLSAIRSSELRNHYYNELGATKLACLWVLERFKQDDSIITNIA
jgi:hypothetical protein